MRNTLLAATQGALTPHLIQHLWAAFLADATKPKADGTALDAKTVEDRASAKYFAEWAANYLKTHRVAEFSYADGGNLRLTNGVSVQVSPPDPNSGMTQDAGAVSITDAAEGHSPTVGAHANRIF